MIVNRRYGSSINLPAHWEGGARTTSLLAAHLAKRNTKFGGGGTPEAIPLLRDATGQEARAGKNFYPVGSRSDSFGAFPPTPFPRTRTGSVRDFAFCPPPPEADRRSKSFSEFSVWIFAKKVRIFRQRRTGCSA